MISTAAQPERTATAATPVVRVRSLRKVIGDRVVLRDLDFAVAPGAMVALVGANGAGKSTLLRILAGLSRPTSGGVELFGEPLAQNARALRWRIGYIAHSSMLYRELSARENLLLFGRLHGLPSPRRRADEVLDQLGLAGRAHDPLKTFSRGMLQRAAIARALLCDPDLLLADEPFTGLDAPSSRTLEAMLASLNAQGKAVILTNHDVAQSLSLTCAAVSGGVGRVLVLHGGRLMVNESAAGIDTETVLMEISRR